MALSRSLSSGASSLRAHQQRLDVISNNIANVNTTGYKSSRANFADQFSQVYSHGTSPDSAAGNGVGGVDPYQVGLGVTVGSIQQNMTQGNIESTERSLDIALQGDGFFVYNYNGRQLYSRAGTLNRDEEGYIVDSSTGAYLQGYNLQSDADGLIVKDSDGVNQLNRRVENLRIEPNTISAPSQTQSITLSGNLNSNASVDTERVTSINIYDQNGGVHSVTVTFTKTANSNEYSVNASIDGNEVPLTGLDADGNEIDGTLVTFNNDGTINSPMQLKLTAADANTALASQVFNDTEPKDITFTLAEKGNLLGGLTQFGGPNSATMIEQDGFQSGDLLGLSVDSEGKVWGSFTNGQSEILGQVVVSTFTNSGGLVKEGNNYYSEAPNSGVPNIGTAGEIFESTSVVGSALEQSNVDLTIEFTDMIITQRAYEAASRTVTTSNELLQQLVNIKR